MSERFKFRAFDTFAEKMIQNPISICEGELYEWCPDGLHIKHDIGDSAIVMQCTGLKDKNGKLIYEKDFVKYLDYICEIVYKRGAFILEVRKGKKDGFFHFYDMHNSFLEVIGNKFENPELLKECE